MGAETVPLLTLSLNNDKFMGKKKTRDGYERELRAMIKERTGKDCEKWLGPQIRATAANMVVIDKMQDELLESGSFLQMVVGSMGQAKNEPNPLCSLYDKAQRTLMLQLESLGLNYKTMPSKVNDKTKPELDEDDPMLNYFRKSQ